MIPIHPVWDPPAWFVVIDSHVFTVPTMQTSFHSTFADRIELLGYDIEIGPSEVNLDLVWRSASPMADDYAFFVHLYEPGHPAAIQVQRDTMPLDGQYPTSGWVAHEVIVDHVRLSLETLEAGQYEIALGWYDPYSPTLDRLQAVDAQERVWEDSRVILPTTVVVP